MADRVLNQVAIAGKPTAGTALSGATTGVKLSYVVPAGRNAMLRWMSVSNFSGGSPTVALQVIVGGLTITLTSITTNTFQQQNIPLNAGDTAQLNVTALVAATSFDGIIGAEEFLVT